MGLLDTLKKYREVEALYKPLALSVAANTLSQNFDALQQTKNYADQLADLSEKYRQEWNADAINRDPEFDKAWDTIVAGYKSMSKLIDESLLLSKYGQNMTDKGTN